MFSRVAIIGEMVMKIMNTSFEEMAHNDIESLFTSNGAYSLGLGDVFTKLKKQNAQYTRPYYNQIRKVIWQMIDDGELELTVDRRLRYVKRDE